MACSSCDPSLFCRGLNLAEKISPADSEMCACMIDLAYLYKSQGRLAEPRQCLQGLELQQR
jgi:hypothetical protein